MPPLPRPFTLHIPDADIADLRDRLARTRWPDEPPGEPWTTGTDLAWLRDLVAWWRDGFDWRAMEARLNAFPQFKVALGAIDLHYLHVPGRGPKPMPLLLSHGWPGSVVEFLDIIPRLTDPARFGGDPADAFTVIAPSLPGYGLSFTPGQRRFAPEEIAELFVSLMSEVLGFGRFGAQGGDWGAFVSGIMAHRRPEKLIGIHLNLLSGLVTGLPATAPTPEERSYLANLGEWQKEGRGYALVQGTRPQTLAYALTDSPAGLAAWICDKFRAWSGGNIDAVPRDAMLANVALYWFTGAVGSSFWPYYARQHGGPLIPAGATIGVPTGYAEFPDEILRPPYSIASRVFTDLRHWTRMERGGHFAAMGEPEALARDVADFFRPLR